MSTKHDPIIHAAIIQAAAALTASMVVARATTRAPASRVDEEFARCLDIVEAKYDAHLARHGEK